MSVKLLSFLGYVFVNLIIKTMRFEYIGREHEKSGMLEGKGILSVWHNRLLMFCYIYRNRDDCYAMISQSRDGELVSRFVGHMGFHPVRGSSSRGGKAALKSLAKSLIQGGYVTITPDGPRGPRYRVQRGVIYLSKFSGARIVPAAYNASRKKVFNSWDRFIFPLPFSRIVVIYGEPVFVPENANLKIIEQKRLELERKLTEITEAADRYFEKGKP
jgi:lysophospholipid acyltransferase (LPLAT)-like uncharacterized protein